MRETTPAGVTPYFFVWTDGVAVMKSSPHPTEAEEFIDYLTTTGEQVREQTEGSRRLGSAGPRWVRASTARA